MSARTCADCGHRLDIHTPDGCVALHLDGSLCACPTPTPERPEGETMKHHTLGYLNPTGLFGPNATPQGCSSTPPARERVVAVVAGIKRFQAARRYGTGWNDALAEVTRALAEADRAAAVAEAVERAAKVCESRAVSLYLQKREDGSRHIAESNEASKCASAIRALPAPEPEEEWCYACGHDAAAHRDHGDLGGCRDCHCSEYQLPPAPEPHDVADVNHAHEPRGMLAWVERFGHSIMCYPCSTPGQPYQFVIGDGAPAATVMGAYENARFDYAAGASLPAPSARREHERTL